MHRSLLNNKVQVDIVLTCRFLDLKTGLLVSAALGLSALVAAVPEAWPELMFLPSDFSEVTSSFPVDAVSVAPAACSCR